MANKYVDIKVLQYAVQTLSQAITKTFAMRNATVTNLEIVNDIPTGKTDKEWSIKITYADDSTASPHFVILGLKEIFSDIDLSLYYTKTEVDGLIPDVSNFITMTDVANALVDYYQKTDVYTKTEVDALIPDVSSFITGGDVDTKLTDYYKKTEVDALIPDVSGFVTDSDVDTKLGDYYKKTETYSQSEVDALIPDVSSFITDTDVDTKLNDYAKSTDVYTKTEVDGLIPDVSGFITDTDIDSKLNDYAKSADVYTKTEVDGMIPDVSGFIDESAVDTKLKDYYKKTETYKQSEVDALINPFIKESEVDTKLKDYYKKTETYNKTEVDGKFNDYYKKVDTYSKTETDTLLDDKANQNDVDVLSSKVSQIFSSMVDNTTLDGIVQDIKTQVANKLEDSDLNVIRSDIKSLQTKTKNLEDGKLDKTALPTKVSAFENDAKYQTEDEVSTTVTTAADQALADAKTYVNGRIADINTLDPNDFYNKTQTDNKLTGYYKKTETYNQTEVDNKLALKAGLNVATESSNGLLSAELYSIIKEIDPDSMGLNGEDGLTPDIDIKTVGNVHTITFTTGDQIKSFTLTDGVDGVNGKDGKNGTNGTNGTNGISVTSAKINTRNHLIITLSNNTTVDAGNIDSEALEITNIALNSKSELVITLSDGSTQNLGNVRGAKGKGITKIAIDDTTHEIIVTYDDGTTDNAGMIEGVKGDKGDTGEPGKGLSSLNIDDNENIIATYENGTTQNLGTIVGAKGAKGDPGTAGVSVSTVAADKNNNLIVTLSDGTKFNLGNYVGPDGRGIKSVGVNGDYELILTMTDNTVVNAGKLEVNVKDIFVTAAELNDEGELIFTFSDGSTQNNGKINGVEGFSIREYVQLTSGQEIKSGCMVLWQNMIYKVVTDFTCTTNFNTDKANMQKITTDAVLDDLYNVYAVTVPVGEVPMTFDEWMHEWMEQRFDNPVVSYATISNRTSFNSGAMYNLSYKDCVGGRVFDGDTITLPDSGTYLLVLETPQYASSSVNGYRYSYVYDMQRNLYIHDECIMVYSGYIEYLFAYPSIRCTITGEAGDRFQIKVKNRNGTTYTGAPSNRVYLYKMTTSNHVVNVEDLYNIYLSSTDDTDPMTLEEWVEHIYNRDSFRMEGVFNQSYTDATDVLLNGFSFSNGNEDLMCDDYGRFYAPYSGLYYIRLQLKLDKTNNYPSRFYLVKNGKFGEEGYSTKVISQSTEGYQTNSAFLQSLNSVFWLTKGDYFTIGFQSSVKDTNTLKTISSFEYGLIGGGGASGGGGSSESGGSASSGIQLYNTLGIGSLVRENAVIQYQRRLYRVTEDFFCTDVFTQDRTHMQQFYGSGHGVIDYDDVRIDHTEEFLPGEFIIKRTQVQAENEQGQSYTADVDDLYEVVSAFTWSGNFDYDKVNLKKILGSFDDYDTVIKKLEEEIDAINQTNSDLEDIINDLASILDDINRTVV